jgi:hypothetical protein
MEDTCVVIKLMSGEELVGFVSVDDIALSNADFLMKYPLRLVTMPSGPESLSISLMKFMPYTKTDVFAINAEAIMICEPAAEDLIKYYQNILEFYTKDEADPESDSSGHKKRRAILAAQQKEVMDTYALMFANSEPIVYH